MNMHVTEACPTQPQQRYLKQHPLAVTVSGTYSPRQRDYFDAFYDALSSLRDETRHSSFIKDTVDSPHFRKIVALGDKVVPLIVHELRKEPSFLFLALQEITSENPVPPSAVGKPRAMVEAWLLWAERSVNAD
jgi:hypothetical protein